MAIRSSSAAAAALACAAAALVCGGAAAARVTISNVVPRVDEDGDVISGGGGGMTYDATTARYYYWSNFYQPCGVEGLATCYCGGNGTFQDECGACIVPGKVAAPRCCGWRNMTFACYSSADLVSWRKEGMNILPVMTDADSPYSSQQQAFFEPFGIFNRLTGWWVLWFLHPFAAGVAVSRSPGGPFEIVSWDADPSPQATDFELYANATTDVVLFKHNSLTNASNGSVLGSQTVAVLADNYLALNGSSAPFAQAQGKTEGGGLFTRGGSAYAMSGTGCCFCPKGSNGFVYRSDGGALGAYAFLGDVIPRDGNGTAVTHAQQRSVTPIYTTAGVTHMFTGTNVGSALDGQKCHDLQYWAPLEFDADGRVLNMSWVSSFTLDLAPPPPPPPLPPRPDDYYLCSLTAPGTCIPVPAGAPGAQPTAGECLQQCPAA